MNNLRLKRKWEGKNIKIRPRVLSLSLKKDTEETVSLEGDYMGPEWTQTWKSSDRSPYESFYLITWDRYKNSTQTGTETKISDRVNFGPGRHVIAKNFQTGLSFCAHGALRQRSSMRKSLQCSQNGGRKAGKNITHAVAETNITKHLSCSWRTSMTFSS